MLVAAMLAGVGLLWLYCRYSAALAWRCAIPMALLGTIVELVSPSEWDTVTVPVVMLSAALILL